MTKIKEYLKTESEVGGEPVPPLSTPAKRKIIDMIKSRTTASVSPSGNPHFADEQKLYKYITS